MALHPSCAKITHCVVPKHAVALQWPSVVALQGAHTALILPAGEALLIFHHGNLKSELDNYLHLQFIDKYRMVNGDIWHKHEVITMKNSVCMKNYVMNKMSKMNRLKTIFMLII